MATTTKRLRVLRETYAALPSVRCKGLCAASCAHIMLTPVEALNIATATGKEPSVIEAAGHSMLAPTDAHGRCPYLVLERCSIYEHRPFICRVFGADPQLACPHGCQPDAPIETAEARAMLKRIARL